jgi:hypothetical protein
MTAYVDDVTFNWIVANIKQSDQINTLQSNVVAQANQILGANAAIITANTAMKGYVDTGNTTMTSYVGNQVSIANVALKDYTDARVTTTQGQITTANTAMKGYVDAVTTAWTANAGLQQTQITNIVTTANANTAAYLTTVGITTTGNISADNVIVTGNVYSRGNIAITSNIARNVYVNSYAPLSTQGNVGDIWYQTY